MILGISLTYSCYFHVYPAIFWAMKDWQLAAKPDKLMNITPIIRPGLLCILYIYGRCIYIYTYVYIRPG